MRVAPEVFGGSVMDAELKAKWIEALRSGKYKQCRSSLRQNDGFCCLGVLADANGEQWSTEKWLMPGQYRVVRGGGCLFYGVQQGLLTEEQMDALADMNDEGKSFSEIADYIEQNL
jgi:hypothetical protein